MQLAVSDSIHLELLEQAHAPVLLNMIVANKHHLRPWLAFADHLNTLALAQQFIEGTIERNKVNQEYAFLIYQQEEAVGRIGVYKIDHTHSSAEIGYWIIASKEGKGIVTAGCKALLTFCFETLLLNRIEIRCATLNTRSFTIPQKLGFTREGVLRQCEYIQGEFVDHYIYSILKKEYEKGFHP